MTLFLLKAVAIFYLVMGISLLLNQKVYKKFMKELAGEPSLTTLMFGFIAFIVGLPLVLAHNKWGNLNEIIVSIWAWASFAKGSMILCFPESYRDLAKKLNNETYIKYSSTITLVLGLYISYLAFAK